MLLFAFALTTAALACTDKAQHPATPTTMIVALDGGASTSTTTSVAASDAPASPAIAGDSGPDYYSCSVDSDCVAVPRAGCCPTGHKEAVNKQSVDAYKASVVCEGRRMCPQYRVLDRRLPFCSNDSHKCEMVQPDQIVCGGAGPNPHACPSGSQCDGTGHCAAKP
ncbi:MAG: hypothetical protein ACLQVI_04285 [Polyangiaceae bacterium]